MTTTRTTLTTANPSQLLLVRAPSLNHKCLYTTPLPLQPLRNHPKIPLLVWDFPSIFPISSSTIPASGFLLPASCPSAASRLLLQFCSAKNAFSSPIKVPIFARSSQPTTRVGRPFLAARRLSSRQRIPRLPVPASIIRYYRRPARDFPPTFTASSPTISASGFLLPASCPSRSPSSFNPAAPEAWLVWDFPSIFPISSPTIPASGFLLPASCPSTASRLLYQFCSAKNAFSSPSRTPPRFPLFTRLTLEGMGRLLFLVFLLGSGLVHSATTVDELIRRVETRYNGTRTLSVEFVENYNMQGHPRPPEEGKLTLRKERKMRWDYVRPAGKLFISDGKTVYLYSAAENRVEKMPLKETEDMRAPLAFLLPARHEEGISRFFQQRSQRWRILAPCQIQE